MLIVDMKMPKNCAECGLVDESDRCVLLGTFAGDKSVRIPKCPIIGVLPQQHGDLIDRDHFKENLDMVCDAGGWLEPITQAVRVYCKKQVDAEKTIVPATERSET